MEIELKHLIDQIKQEGVKEAEKKAAEIIQQAKQDAQVIKENANSESERIVTDAKKQAQRAQESAEQAIKQAARDTVLALKDKITSLFDNILKREISKQLTQDVLKGLVAAIITNFKKEGSMEIEVLLNKNEKTQLEKTLFDELTTEMKKGVSLAILPGDEHGFRIGQKGKDYYYDFTEEALTEAFKHFLTPKLADLLNSK